MTIEKKYQFENTDAEGNIIPFEDVITFEDENELFLLQCGLEYSPTLGCFVGSYLDEASSAIVKKAFNELRDKFVWRSFTDCTYDEHNDRGIWYEKFMFLPKNHSQLNKNLTLGLYTGHPFVRKKYDNFRFTDCH